MDRATFEHALETVNAKAIAIGSSGYYDEACFGNWLIKVNSTPNRRLIWDARDRCYVVEEETSEVFNGNPVWRELWTDPSPQLDSVRIAMEKLCEGLAPYK